MQGFITECHFDFAERWFPGIRRFYLTLTHKPATFLELVWEYERFLGRLAPESPDCQTQIAGRQAR
jgi:hypothetical protein